MKFLRRPLLLFALPAVVIAIAGNARGALLLDRNSVAQLEWWRLWTGHWVHFSPSHLLWNLAVLLAAGSWLERVRPGLLGWFSIGAAPLISLAVLAGEPGLAAYGGLSALATGVVVLLGLQQLQRPGATRLLWTGVLVLLAAKLVGEALRGESWLLQFDRNAVRLSRVAHIAGAAAGGLSHLLLTLFLRRWTSPARCGRHTAAFPPAALPTSASAHLSILRPGPDA